MEPHVVPEARGFKRPLLIALAVVIAVVLHRLATQGTGTPVGAVAWPGTLLVAAIVGLIGGLAHEGLRPSTRPGPVGRAFFSWFIPIAGGLALMHMGGMTNYRLRAVLDEPSWALVRPAYLAVLVSAALATRHRRLVKRS